MIESARKHGPFDPRFSASARKDPEAIARRHRRVLSAERLEEAQRNAAGWAALQEWEEDGGAVH